MSGATGVFNHIDFGEDGGLTVLTRGCLLDGGPFNIQPRLCL